MRDKCGIVGLHSNSSEDVSSFIYYGLYALQHRGQESAGMATFNNDQLHHYYGMGLVTDAFKDCSFEELPGSVGIGHIRYSTTGNSKLENSQPFITDFNNGILATAHNGDIINSNSLRKQLIDEGFKFRSTTDSEVICNLLKREHEKTGDMIKTIENLSELIVGSYSLVILVNDKLYALRDPAGMKPLSIARMDDFFMIASESVAFDVIGANLLRDVEPGEVVYFENNEIRSHHLKIAESMRNAHCIFEYVYFARPDSIIDNNSVYNVRLNIGKKLFEEYPIDADVVMPVPDSAIPAAIGYARASGIDYGEGLIKNRYVGRTFIMPTQGEREIAVKLKMNPLKSELEGKRIILIDDSIVRGTTSKSLIRLLKDSGAKEIHLLVGCPPIISPCYYGISMATKKELIGANNTVEEIKEILDVDSLGYLSLDSLVSTINLPFEDLCLGCLNEEYPTEIQNIGSYNEC
ncbi:amidophosphoribosyltransferase [Methanobrevibacter filiformis]|uniref:Amidophosphoribosyltransferase n=1 Tax=Methanobrevibacter filiformis TaxID=55758 RepID=A0A162FKN7_9EURY|nr:amidophosphoribosyltransferase [Methanobrevibacter filiformis]KZX11450.1 amidophosphoribosyltransferase precursor [Methanobrevibacter filiformis]